MLQDDFPRLIRAARKKRKLTMIAIAEKTGILSPIYRLIEKGKIFPDQEKFVILCDFFEFDMQYSDYS